MSLRNNATRVSPVPCPSRPPEPVEEPTVTIRVFVRDDETDVQVDFRRDPKGWLRIRDALAAVKAKIEHEFETQERCPARPKSIGSGDGR
jgi:hypothetical protein